MPTKKPIGTVTHFYDKISVAAIALAAGVKQGDSVSIGKHNSFVEQTITSMQHNDQKITTARKGQEIGIKVRERVKTGDLVFKV